MGSRSRAAAARERGKVFLNGLEARAADVRLRLKAGDEIRVWEDRPGSARRRAAPFTSGPLRILYEDQFLIVLDKPAGLLAVPLERRGEEISIFDQIEDHLRSHGKRKPLVVHRIDRDTSGVVLFAKDGRTHAALKQQFRARTPERVYLAVVYGHPTPASGIWRDHLVWDSKALIQKETHPNDPRAAEAISQYRVVESFESTSFVEVRLTTGKRNQIRIQARLRGHTLVGEVRYTFGPDELRPDPIQATGAPRMAPDLSSSRRTKTDDVRGASCPPIWRSFSPVYVRNSLTLSDSPYFFVSPDSLSSARLLQVKTKSPCSLSRASETEPLMRSMYKPNISATGRLASTIAGAALAVVGYQRSNKALGLAGLGLIARGASGWCPVTAAFDPDAHYDTETPDDIWAVRAAVMVEDAITIYRPVSEVYCYWRNLENLPSFMDHLEEVRVTDRFRSHWVARGPARRARRMGRGDHQRHSSVAALVEIGGTFRRHQRRLRPVQAGRRARDTGACEAAIRSAGGQDGRDRGLAPRRRPSTSGCGGSAPLQTTARDRGRVNRRISCNAVEPAAAPRLDASETTGDFGSVR